MLPGLAITWSLSSVTAYGIHGLTLAQQYLSEGENLVLTSLPTGVYLNPLQQRRIQPYLDMAPKLAEILKNNPHEKVTLRMPAFHAVGNDFLGFPGQFQVRGSPNVGGAAIEYCTMSDEAKGVGKFYDKIIAYSHYTADFLSSLNVAPVVVCHQGVDTGMFHPRQKSGLYKNRFVIFSGGKFEHRKGQDIVLAAFKHFAARHDDALLVCAWQTIMPIQGFPLRPYSHLTSLPAQEPGQPLHLDEWLLAEGLHPRQVIALPFLPQATMPSIMAECDVAVFPSRAEGGTNFVAMECMAMGIPTFVANGTGQKDLVSHLGAPHFGHPQPVQNSGIYPSVEGWAETPVEAVVEALERVYADWQTARDQALTLADTMKAWDWTAQNQRMLKELAR